MTSEDMTSDDAKSTAPVDVDVSASKWLREMGAVRPMAPAANEVLVLGRWRDGHYPIEWQRYYDKLSRDMAGNLTTREPIEQWRIFGVLVCEQMTKTDCERILRQVQ